MKILITLLLFSTSVFASEELIIGEFTTVSFSHEEHSPPTNLEEMLFASALQKCRSPDRLNPRLVQQVSPSQRVAHHGLAKNYFAYFSVYLCRYERPIKNEIRRLRTGGDDSQPPSVSPNDPFCDCPTGYTCKVRWGNPLFTCIAPPPSTPVPPVCPPQPPRPTPTPFPPLDDQPIVPPGQW